VLKGHQEAGQMCQSKRSYVGLPPPPHLGVDFVEETVAQKSDHFIDNFKFKS